jgi:hypothetical protein
VPAAPNEVRVSGYKTSGSLANWSRPCNGATEGAAMSADEHVKEVDVDLIEIDEVAANAGALTASARL